MRMREFMWTTPDGTTYRLRTDQLDGCVWVDIGNTNEEELLQALAAHPDIVEQFLTKGGPGGTIATSPGAASDPAVPGPPEVAICCGGTGRFSIDVPGRAGPLISFCSCAAGQRAAASFRAAGGIYVGAAKSGSLNFGDPSQRGGQ